MNLLDWVHNDMQRFSDIAPMFHLIYGRELIGAEYREHYPSPTVDEHGEVTFA